MKSKFNLAFAALAAMALAQPVAAETQGVTDTSVTFGSVNDLSGIFAAAGVPAANGAKLRFREANEAGGVHGRQINLIVEDNGYQLPRAMQGYNKLLNRDRVFAMMLSIGTPMNLAGFRLMDPIGMPNFLPLSAASVMLSEPVHNKFVGFSTIYDQAGAGVNFLHSEFGLNKFCAMYLPTDYGEEVYNGARDAVAAAGLEFAAETTHKGDEADFVGSLSRLRDAGCEGVVLALGVRQLITVVGTAKKMDLADMKFFTTSSGFFTAIAEVPGGVTEGFYALAGWEDLAARADEPVPAKFIADYTAEFGETPSGFALIGYTAADQIVRALDAAGPDLTTESFIAGIETLNYWDDLMANQISYGPDDHQGADGIVISVVEDGQWKVVTKVE